MEDAVVIHCHIYDPTGFNLFKPEPNARAECRTIRCCYSNCPLLAKKQCHMLGGLFGNYCPYGKSSREVGLTKRARNFHKWVRDQRDKYKDVPHLSVPERKLEFVGDYVILPYAHMDMCKEVAFSHSKSGVLPRTEWTVENVIKLIEFVPQALFGGTIKRYQNEEVPKFLLHLREKDQDMWKQLIERMPDLDSPPDHVGRKALLKTLNTPLEWTESSNNGKYPVTWQWDGTTLKTSSPDAYDKTWGKVKLESFAIEGTPKDDTAVVVRSNDWVNEKTEFVD